MTLFVVATEVPADYWRPLCVTLGVGVLLFLMLDVLLIRYLIVRALRLQDTLTELADRAADRLGLTFDLSEMASAQQRKWLAELLEDYGGDNPFNPFAGLGAPQDWEEQLRSELVRDREREG
jgi:hypothetical protein